MLEYRKCVVCGKQSLKLLIRVEESGTPHGQPGHNIVYGYKDIAVCDHCGCGQLESYSHDCWTIEDPWDMYWWYAIDVAGVETIRNRIGKCAAPDVPKCECDFHQILQSQLRYIFSGFPHARSARHAKHYCWLLVDPTADDTSLAIAIDRSKSSQDIAIGGQIVTTP